MAMLRGILCTRKTGWQAELTLVVRYKPRYGLIAGDKFYLSSFIIDCNRTLACTATGYLRNSLPVGGGCVYVLQMLFFRPPKL